MLEWLMLHWKESLLALEALLVGVIAVALLVPGEQPDKALQGALELLKKFSLK